MGFPAPDLNRFMTRGSATQAATEIWPRSTTPTTVIVTGAQRLRNRLELKVDGSDVEVYAESRPAIQIGIVSARPAADGASRK